MELEEIPLLVLVVDPNASSALALNEALMRDNRVSHVERVSDLNDARRELSGSHFNTVFIDPVSLDLTVASEFIFTVRRTYPDIVFVLFVDSAEVNARRDEFYSGDRYRFQHYHTLDKRAPLAAFPDEVGATVSRCITYLRQRTSAEGLQALRAVVEKLTREKNHEQIVPANLDAELVRAISLVAPQPPETRSSRPKVFLSHRLAETDYVDGFTQLLESQGFTVVVGTALNTYISQGVLQRIAEADYFVSLMTCDQEKAGGNFTTSSWILEEKGAALALQKRIVLLVEHGVDDVGGLQGDWQVIRFSPKGFIQAAMQAIHQLKSYSGSFAQPGP